jgi:hypothetical protein
MSNYLHFLIGFILGILIPKYKLMRGKQLTRSSKFLQSIQ